MGSHSSRKPAMSAAVGSHQADVPYTIKLSDGRRVYVEVPGRWTGFDRSGKIAFTAEGMRFLDRIRALMMRNDAIPTPGFLRSLREAMGLTQLQLAGKLGVNKLTVSRWERGALRPGPKSIKALRALRDRSVRQGVLLAG